LIEYIPSDPAFRMCPDMRFEKRVDVLNGVVLDVKGRADMYRMPIVIKIINGYMWDD
jgi:hypothetical protein